MTDTVAKPDPKVQTIATFLNQLIDAKAKKDNHDLIETKKRVAFDEISELLTAGVKKEIAEGMKFSVVDKKGRKKEKSFSSKGQEYAVDTFGSTKKGHGLSSEDHEKVYLAMGAIVDLTRKAIDKILAIKTSDGKPIYDFGSKDEAIKEKAKQDFTSLIEYEVFSPLVREKLLPETFVLDDYSEVQKLLNNTFKQYEATTKDEVVKKEVKAVDDQINFDGGRLKADMLKGFGAKAEQMKDHFVAKFVSKEKLEKLEKGAKFAKQGANLLLSLGKAGVNIKGYTEEEGSNKNSFTKEVNYLQMNDKERLEFATQKRSKMIESVFSGVQEKLEALGIDQDKIDVEKVGEFIDSFLKNVVDSDPFFYTTTSAELLINGIMDGIDIGGMSASMYASDESVKQMLKFNAECQAAPDRFDETISEAIGEGISSEAKVAFEGSFSNHIFVSDILKSSTDKRGELIASKFSEALKKGFMEASPKSDLFTKNGQSVASAFGDAFSATHFDQLSSTPESAFEHLFNAGKTAIEKGVTSELKVQLSSSETIKAIIQAKSIPPESFEELQESEEELLEYERALVLIDDGGITLAEQKSIEKLIASMEKDRQTLELVAKIGSAFSSLGTSTVNIANWATDSLSDVVAGEILGPLKAAQLIMQLSVNAIKAAGRMTLLMTFQQNLARSKTAVSSLTSTIQGFLDNKKEQITFRTIEDSLLVIQAAGAILGSIPEPHAMAIGKTLGLVAVAAQEGRKLTEMIYSEKKLSEAWATTKAAMANPRDRSLGLSALRLNPTLGMHAVAWAGMEKKPPDPIARMFLDSVGLNEQTLAVSGTEKKVRKYLETLLNEDRVMLDPSKIKVNWAPENYELTAQDWFIVTSRAQTIAPTKLRPGPEKTVLECLKFTDKHQVPTIQQRLNSGVLLPEDLEQFKTECQELKVALDIYSPLTVDGAKHEEMDTITAKFILLANAHEGKLKELLPVDGERSREILGALAQDIALIDLCIDENAELKQPRKSLREVQEILVSESDGLEEIKLRANDCSEDTFIMTQPSYSNIVLNAQQKIGLLETAINKEKILAN